MSICCYKNCTNIQIPFSKLSFFALPKDSRREIWITNSGNEELEHIGINAKRFFCEKHFHANHLRRQFNRTILYRHAVPIEYNECFAGDFIESTRSTDDTQCVDAQSVSCQIESELPTTQVDETSFEKDVIDNLLQTIDNQSDSPISEINLNQHSIDTGLSDTSNDNNPVNFAIDETIQIENDDEEENEGNYENYLFDLSEYSQQGVSSYPSVTGSSEDNQNENLTESEIDEEIIEVENNTNHIDTQEAESLITSTEREVPTLKLNSDEKYFALSLFGTLKRLTPLQQQAAKLHILTYLTKMEYGEHAKLE